MTVYVVTGTGTMPSKELPAQLNDLWDKAEQEQETFWFNYTPEVAETQTGEQLIEFCSDNRIICKKVRSVVDAFKNAPDGETVVVLALFPLNDGVLAPDDELFDSIQSAFEEGVKVYGLNDSLEEVTNGPAAKDVEESPKPKRSETVLSADRDDEDENDDESEPLDRLYLMGLTGMELGALAEGMGIPYTTKEETIAKILGSEITEPVLVEDVVDTNETVKDTPDSDVEMAIVVIHSKNGIRMAQVPYSQVAHF